VFGFRDSVLGIRKSEQTQAGFVLDK